MSVSKRGKKGVFYMNFTISGNRVFRATGKYTKREAKHVEALEKQRLLQELNSSSKDKFPSLRLTEAINIVFREKWIHGKDATGSMERAELVAGIIGDIPIGLIDEKIVKALVAALERKQRKPATINRYLANLKTILKHFNLDVSFIKLKKEKNGRLRVMTREEEQKAVQLLREAEAKGKRPYYSEAADLVEVLVDTGMRLSELLNLKYEDVDFSSNLISIWLNKADRPRSIPMTVRVKSRLQERQSNSTKPFSITVDEAERALQWVRAEMGQSGKDPLTWHTLRHTCASRLVNAGVDLYIVKEWLGHSSIQITERYAHLNPKKLSEAVAVLEK